MLFFKKLIKNIFYPHIAVILGLLPFSITFLILSLVYFSPSSIIAILSYLSAFYMLTVICLKIPKIISFFKNIKNKNKLAQKWFTDVQVRIKISLYCSLIWNGAYAIFQLCLGIYHNSLWFYSMFVYYLLLALMRFFLVFTTKNYTQKDSQFEIKNTLLCGCLLLFMNLALGVIIAFIVMQNKIFEHSEITTIALATYTFTTFIFAIVNCVRYKKYSNLVYSSAKKISLITATVSMLTLESTMLSTFGKNDNNNFNMLMLAISGAVVIIFTIIMAIIIIVQACKKYNKNINN